MGGNGCLYKLLMDLQVILSTDRVLRLTGSGSGVTALEVETDPLSLRQVSERPSTCHVLSLSLLLLSHLSAGSVNEPDRIL